MVYDPILDPVRNVCENMTYMIQTMYKQMEDLMLATTESMDEKKRITSALRRFLPNGQANEMGWSINLRALRHTIEARTSRHAEWEIRAVFNQVYDLIKEKYPTMFLDAKLEEVRDLNEITFKNKKI